MKPLKSILYVSFSQLPSTAANSVHVMKMCQAFKKIGKDITLIACIKAGTLSDVFHHYHIKVPFPIHHFRMPSIRVLGKFIYLMQALFFTLRGTWDLIYSRDLWSAFLLTLLQKKIIFECHQVPSGGLKKIILLRLLRNSHVKTVVCISERMRALLIENFCGAEKLIVEHDAVDLEDALDSHTDLRLSLNLPTDRFILGYTGSLHHGRGVEILLDMAKFFPQFYFVIVGGSESQVQDLKTETKALKLKNLLLVGYVPFGRVSSYLAASDVLLMPYQAQVMLLGNKHNTAEFMSPLKMFEYMGSGKPIVSSDLPVLREVLRQGENALMVSAADSPAWCGAVQKLQADPILAKRLGLKARLDVEKHTWDRRAERILAEIERIKENY